MRQYFLFYPRSTARDAPMGRITRRHEPVVMDFFAGCGGLSLGFELAGFKPIFVNELNADAMSTYLRNRREYPYLDDLQVDDIRKLVENDGAQLDGLLARLKQEFKVDASKGEIDVIVGGPPCQGFSGIGHRRSYSVEKKQLPANHLYQNFAYVIGRVRPKLFLFENVRGLLSSRWTARGNKGEIWADVRGTLASIPGYRTAWAEVRAKDYGVPQNRPRVLLVGVRDDLNWTPDPGTGPGADAVKRGFLPAPTNNAPDLADLLGDLVDKRYENGGATNAYPIDPENSVQRWFRTIHPSKVVLKRGAPVTEHEYSNHDKRIVAKFEYMLGHGGKIPPRFATKKFAQRVLPRHWGDEGPTITATSLPDDYVHFAQPRTLSVREWARLQCFPDWYEFSGKRTTGGLRRAGNPLEGNFEREAPKYTQIGNAVPVLLARAIGNHFRKILGE